MNQAKQDLLVIAAQQGNRQAFASLYKSYNPPLLRFAYKICLDEPMSQEAVQDAWIKVFKNLRRLDDPRTFKAWVFKAVRWRALDLLRKRTNNAEDCLDDSELESNTDEPLYVRGELLQIVNKLPDVERQVIYLFYLEDMKIIEISQVLDIPAGTVKSRLNRARNYLREKFDDE